MDQARVGSTPAQPPPAPEPGPEGVFTAPRPDVDDGGRRGRAEVIGSGVARTARWSLQLLLIAAGLTLIGLLVVALWSIVFPVFLGLVIATVIEPPVSRLRERGVPGALATGIIMLLGLGVIAAVVVLLAPSVAGQAPQIVQGAVGGIQQIQDWLSGPPFNLGASQIGQYVEAATERLQQSAGQIAGGVVTGLTSIATGIVNAVLALVLAFLFVKDGPRFVPWMRHAVGSRAGTHLEQVSRRAWGRLGGFIRSQALIGLVDAVFIGVGLVIFGVPLALPLAVLTFFGAFIPIIGALVAGALSVLIALVVQGPTTALGVLILILVVQQVEGNLLQPVVQGKGLGLNAAVVILAVTGGSSLAGIAGAFLAVPVTAVLAEVLRYISERIDDRTGEPHPGGVPPAVQERRPWRERLHVRRRSDSAETASAETASAAEGPGAPGAAPGAPGARRKDPEGSEDAERPEDGDGAKGDGAKAAADRPTS